MGKESRRHHPYRKPDQKPAPRIIMTRNQTLFLRSQDRSTLREHKDKDLQAAKNNFCVTQNNVIVTRSMYRNILSDRGGHNDHLNTRPFSGISVIPYASSNDMPTIESVKCPSAYPFQFTRNGVRSRLSSLCPSKLNIMPEQSFNPPQTLFRAHASPSSTRQNQTVKALCARADSKDKRRCARNSSSRSRAPPKNSKSRRSVTLRSKTGPRRKSGRPATDKKASQSRSSHSNASGKAARRSRSPAGHLPACKRSGSSGARPTSRYRGRQRQGQTPKDTRGAKRARPSKLSHQSEPSQKSGVFRSRVHAPLRRVKSVAYIGGNHLQDLATGGNDSGLRPAMQGSEPGHQQLATSSSSNGNDKNLSENAGISSTSSSNAKVRKRKFVLIRSRRKPAWARTGLYTSLKHILGWDDS